jgi:very-short-patch-repair endonuclease
MREVNMPKHRVPTIEQPQALYLRQSSTDAESKLWHLLRSRHLFNVKFRRQVPIGPWVVDFVAFEQKLIIEADGGQHAEDTRDQSRDADLRVRGFRTLRLWNNDILTNADGVLEAIIAAAERSPSPRDLWPRPSPTRGEGEAA